MDEFINALARIIRTKDDEIEKLRFCLLQVQYENEKLKEETHVKDFGIEISG